MIINCKKLFLDESQIIFFFFFLLTAKCIYHVNCKINQKLLFFFTSTKNLYYKTDTFYLLLYNNIYKKYKT